MRARAHFRGDFCLGKIVCNANSSANYRRFACDVLSWIARDCAYALGVDRSVMGKLRVYMRDIYRRTLSSLHECNRNSRHYAISTARRARIIAFSTLDYATNTAKSCLNGLHTREATFK